MASSSHKKFKPVKGKAVEDAEEFSYDELDEPRNEKPGRKRKSTSLSSSEAASSSQKKRTSNASTMSVKSTGSQKSKTVTTTKHHYPTVLFEPSEQLLSASTSGTDHHLLLNSLLEELLTAERTSLTEFAQSTQAKAIHGKKYIFESLNDVLNSLSEEINTTQDLKDVTFEPELSKSERSELKPLLEARRQLEEHSRKLEGYEQDIGRLVSDHDLWLGGEVVKSKLEGIPQRVPSSAEHETRQHYQQLLSALEHHCAQILAATEEAEGVVAQARQVQDRLYDSFNKARLDAANVKAPKDPRDILKRMPGLF